MQFVKLQLGCLLVMAYIEITYIVATLRGKIPCNKFFRRVDGSFPMGSVF